jgi:glucose/arabinose dehydrogenase
MKIVSRSAAALLLLAPLSSARAQLTLQPEGQAVFQAGNFVANLNRPNDLAPLPDGRVVIIQRGGEILIRTRDGMLINPAARVPVKPVNNDNEQGLIGILAAPDFESSHVLYLYASIGDTVADKGQVFRATLSDDNTFTFAYDEPLVKLEAPHKHNGSQMIIHKGQLYIGVGDGGFETPIPTNKYAACLNKANGKILRIGLDGSIPADNPLVGLSMVTGCTTANMRSGGFTMLPPETRIYAWGLRAPYRFWIDPVTDLLWIGDVGEKQREELSIGGKGVNFGYPFEEGTYRYPAGQEPFNTFGGCTGMVPSTPCAPPAFEYENTGASGDDSIIGGLIPPPGCGWTAPFTNRYFFGDHGSGRVWTLDVTADRRGVVAGSRKLFGNIPGLSAFRLGPDGTLYLVSNDLNAIARLTPRDRPAGCLLTAAPDGGSAPDGPPATTGTPGAVDAAIHWDGPAADPVADAGASPSPDSRRPDSPGDAPSPPPSGCGCDLGGRSPRPLALIGVLVLGAALARRHRR